MAATQDTHVLLELCKGRLTHAEALFDTIDFDDNRLITCVDFSALMLALGIHVTDAEIQNIRIKCWDPKNLNKGLITRENFLHFYIACLHKGVIKVHKTYSHPDDVFDLLELSNKAAL